MSVAFSMGDSRPAPLRVAILGSGIIGTDLLMKLRRSRRLICMAVAGRHRQSIGLEHARNFGVPVSDGGIDYLAEHAGDYDLVFDATSADGHIAHLPILESLQKISIDLTPAKLGRMHVPSIDDDACLGDTSINMVTCGGQAAIPVACAIARSQSDVSYIEVASSVASASAGPATRANIDEYIHTTEAAICHYTGVAECKTMLSLNPALPSIDMHQTIFAAVEKPDMPALHDALLPLIAKVQQQTPGYQIVLGPAFERDRIVVGIRVRGAGDYLPAYSGNLDIINCAAVAAAECYARSGQAGGQSG